MTSTSTNSLSGRKMVQTYVGAFTTDRRVQRALDQRRVDSIADNFDEAALGSVAASRRSNGDVILLDGQHRVAAALKVGYHGTIWTETWEGLSLQSEARLFRLLNNTKKPNALDLFDIAVTEAEPVALACKRILEKHGLTHHQGRLNSFSAPSSLLRSYSLDDGITLDRVLYVLVTAWGAVRESVQATLIDAMSAFLFKHHSTIDLDRLARRLKAEYGQPIALVGEVRTYSRTRRINKRAAGADILTGVYNKYAKPGKMRLPAWTDESDDSTTA